MSKMGSIDRLFWIYSHLACAQTMTTFMVERDDSTEAQKDVSFPSPFYLKARMQHLVQVVVSLVFAALHLLKGLGEVLENGTLLRWRVVFQSALDGANKLCYEIGIVMIHSIGVFFPLWVKIKTCKSVVDMDSRKSCELGCEGSSSLVFELPRLRDYFPNQSNVVA